MFDIAKNIQAESSDAAVAALAAHPEARLIAGGTDILIKLRHGSLPDCVLVSIHDAQDLKGVELREDGTIAVGPLCTFAALCADPLIQAHLPLLAQGASTVGGPQIRAMGTVGGNICNGATSADTAPALLAYNAQVQIKGPAGLSTLPLHEFYLGPGKVKLGPGQLLYRILVAAKDYQGCQGAYLKYSMRKAMDISTLGVAVLVKLSEDGQYLTDIRIAFGVAAPTPIRAYATESALRGKTTEDGLTLIAGLVREEINPRDSWRASRAFRLQIAGENARRALAQALAGKGGQG